MNNFWKKLTPPILALAPMEGVNDTAFRQICKQGGADVVYTEFVAADAIVHDARKTMDRLAFDPSEQPVIAQIFGHNLESFATAAQKISQLGYAGLDINFGCPARKVVAHGSGVALFRRPAYARELIQRALDSVSIPVSIKMRTSIRAERKELDPDNPRRITAVDFLDAIGDLPVAAIMVHGRSYEQGHRGDIDTDMIREVKQRFKGIVLANGGMTTPQLAKAMLETTGADGVGIARGAMGQPWIFQQIREFLKTGQAAPLNAERVTSMVKEHADVVYRAKGDHGLIEFRKHLSKYITNWPGAAAWRAKAVRITSMADVEEVIAAIKSGLQP